MKAIETTARIDEKGNLHLDEPLKIVNKKVKIIILLPEDAANRYGNKTAADLELLEEPSENTYTLPDEKLLANITSEIKRLPEHLLPYLLNTIAGLLEKKQPSQVQNNKISYEERLRIISEAAKHLTEKTDIEQYMNEFEESRKDRPLPFREP